MQNIITFFRYDKSDDQGPKKSVKAVELSETPAFDFTKIETLFSNSTTSDADKPVCDGVDGKDDSIAEVKVPSEEVCISSWNFGSFFLLPTS